MNEQDRVVEWAQDPDVRKMLMEDADIAARQETERIAVLLIGGHHHGMTIEVSPDSNVVVFSDSDIRYYRHRSMDDQYVFVWGIEDPKVRWLKEVVTGDSMRYERSVFRSLYEAAIAHVEGCDPDYTNQLENAIAAASGLLP